MTLLRYNHQAPTGTIYRSTAFDGAIGQTGDFANDIAGTTVPDGARLVRAEIASDGQSVLLDFEVPDDDPTVRAMQANALLGISVDEGS